jgi:sulfoxide reductase catalytic subunit YedY
MDLKFRRNKAWQDLRGEVTPESVVLSRRTLVAAGAAVALGAGSACAEPKMDVQGVKNAAKHPDSGKALKFAKSNWKVADPLASEDVATGFNNFYEFGTGKYDPKRNAHRLTTSPWAIRVEGDTGAAGNYALADLVDYDKLEERIYRLRCVERWSMVIPWVGVPLADVITKLKPGPNAKYVAFETHLDKDEMNGTRGLMTGIRFPYVEGLRMDEAMNELAFVAVGMYGKALPKQNGAPVRIVVPWKYGYKSPKSIATIRFTDKEPKTAWNESQPGEYGFYSNVNPNRQHPRWSQEIEEVRGETTQNAARNALGLGGGGAQEQSRFRKTEMFNGYEKQVAHLYEGMDLIKNH